MLLSKMKPFLCLQGSKTNDLSISAVFLILFDLAVLLGGKTEGSKPCQFIRCLFRVVWECNDPTTGLREVVVGGYESYTTT